MQFDARAAKLLRPGQHLVVGGCPGLRLEVAPSTKTWTYRYKSPLDGRMKQAALGQWPRMGIMEAAQAWQEKRQQRGDGVEPGTLNPAGAKLERWLPDGAWNRPSSPLHPGRQPATRARMPSTCWRRTKDSSRGVGPRDESFPASHRDLVALLESDVWQLS